MIAGRAPLMKEVRPSTRFYWRSTRTVWASLVSSVPPGGYGRS
jgi:hypothetical protein